MCLRHAEVVVEDDGDEDGTFAVNENIAAGAAASCLEESKASFEDVALCVQVGVAGGRESVRDLNRRPVLQHGG